MSQLVAVCQRVELLDNFALHETEGGKTEPSTSRFEEFVLATAEHEVDVVWVAELEY